MLNFLPQNKNCLTSFSFLVFLFFSCFLFSTTLDGQNQLWTPISNNLLSKEKSANFQDFELFSLDKPLFLAAVEKTTNSNRQFPTQLSIPLEEGHLTNFTLIDAPIIAPNSNSQYATAYTFKVIETANSLVQGRISWMNGVFYGHLIQDGQSIFIENVPIDGVENVYIIYKEQDLKTLGNAALTCGNTLLKQFKQDQSFLHLTANDSLFDTHLKTFKIAIAATEGFTNASGGTKELASAAIVRALTSLNVIYEKDTGIRFILHENNDQLIFTDSMPSPFTDSEDAFGLWAENASLLDGFLGNDNLSLIHI